MQNEITELRNQVRTLKRIVYGFGCLLVAGVVVGATSLQTVPEVIQAKRFEVVNDDGKTVAEIFADEDGGALRILNKDGQPVVGFFADEDGGMLGISNKDGTPVSGLYSDKDGGVLRIYSKDGASVATIFAREDGGAFGILNKDGGTVVGLFSDDNSDGRVITLDNKGEITSTAP